MKTIQDCIEFANANPICYLATAEGDQPRVRVLQFWFADHTGFYFQTGSVKEFPRQLRANPKAEACFYDPSGPLGAMLRVAGSVEFLTERSLKERALEDRPFLKAMGMTADSDALVLFRIAHGEANFWTMADNMKPKDIIRF